MGKRLAENEAVLLDTYHTIVQATNESRAITPPAKWLIDNYHVVEKQIREVRTDLPPGYYRQLPKLADGPLAGYPRVLGVAWAFVAHTDSRFDSEMLVRYMRAYQEVQPLTIGELWAAAITLRIVLVENLRRIAEWIVQGRVSREQADNLADRLLGAGGRVAGPVSALIADYQRTPHPDAFAVQLVHRLRDQDPRITPALESLSQRLAARGTTAEAVVRDEHQRQGAATVTVRNIITSMRLIADADWTELIERISLVDDVLAETGVYPEMDFPTRNLYRGAIEELARCSNLTELAVARHAAAGTTQAKKAGVGCAGALAFPVSDAGYHLLGGGRPAFEAEIGFKAPPHTWLRRSFQALGIRGYLGAVVAGAAIVLAGPLFALSAIGLDTTWLGVLALLGAFPAFDAAVALVNQGVIRSIGAHLLPALALTDGVPKHLRTLIVIPTMLTTREAVEEQVERLEIHYLTSPKGELHFALLSDWVDAETEHLESDATLLATAEEGIAQLNRRYAAARGAPRFLLLHRRRVWNEGEARWIGWERKRGKLHELNELLRGEIDTTFIMSEQQLGAVPADVRYVITLDADTRLPRDTVLRLIGKMAHPLNRPRYDPHEGRVVEGYAVLQPRVTPSLPTGREGSLFQWIFSGTSGLDPYASAVSDVYQDLFGEGSYVGKGIYDVDVFRMALADQVPESTLLSHDLFEGTLARAGLASDIEVVEDFPSRYDASALRQHRWARGDWQLLPWILGFAPGAKNGKRVAIPAIGRWKMLDNLRRTLSAPAAIVAFLVGWSLPFQAAAIWTAFLLLTIVLPILTPILAAVVPGRSGSEVRNHLGALRVDLRLAFAQSGLMIANLAHQAWLMGDAIARALTRIFFTRRHLLEWVTAAQASIGPRLDLLGFYRRMAGALFVAVAAVIVTWVWAPENWPLVLPFVALWLASPAIARWTSRAPAAATRLSMAADDRRALRLIARRTWGFFDTFVTPADHMLPPDNFQEDPTPKLAHRTSPTNLGLYLLSVASARDFGWIGTIDAIERLDAAFSSMERLARFRGHFYNWYDTQDLRPLDPRYISSVDSGNLAGHLIALANACRDWVERPFTVSQILAGVADTIELMRAEADKLREGRRTQTVTWRQLEEALVLLTVNATRAMADSEDIATRLSELAAAAETLADIAQALLTERNDGTGADLVLWAEKTLAAVESHRRDLEWTSAPANLAARLAVLEKSARETALAMEFGFLIDHDRKLLSIGYLASEGRLDPSCYDLLASEARLASFIAIAKGDVPSRHWFHLGRTVTPVSLGAALMSWSGSMFEYLMPSLVMRAPEGSLLEQTNRLIVYGQIEHGANIGVPWGFSESAYNVRDLEFTYQYSNFGVPALGLKRGLGENVVVAPYATALATMVDPKSSAQNFKRLAAIGAAGRYGFYEALDYTPARLPEGKSAMIVRAYMAHHQGMTIVAIANALFEGRMRARFHAEPIVQATELLLQERMPRNIAVSPAWAAEMQSTSRIKDITPLAVRRLITPHSGDASTQLLSNGRYAVMLTAAGSGYSRWRDLAVTRWREDATCDDWGSYVFLRDVDSGTVWSAGFQPSGAEPDAYSAVFNEDRAEVTRSDGTLKTTMEVLVSAEDDAEVRRISIANFGSQVREIDVTSYAELVLAPQAADVSHPAFSKLFVETEYRPELGAILATRRRRSSAEQEIWAAHLAVADSAAIGEAWVETDRALFLGRAGSVRNAIGVMDGRPLSNSVGTVLDAVFALRRRVRVAPGETAHIAFWTVVASTREQLLDLVDKHRDTTAFERAATLAWTQAQVQLHHLGITSSQASVFQRLAGYLLYATPTLRPPSDTIRRGAGAQSGLWPLGISGDLPILLLRIMDIEHLDMAHQLLRAHEYLQMKQFAFDLVIVNERASSYVQDLQIGLETLVRQSRSLPQAGVEGPRGRVFILRADLISPETRALLTSTARAVFVGRHGLLSDQLDRATTSETSSKIVRKRTVPASSNKVLSPILEFFNGLGGFADLGREYVAVLGPGQSTPAPWINVVANPSFGFQVGTEGGGTTWSVNSKENHLTPWSNDPVADPHGEAFYVSDDATGDLWCPTARPIRNETGSYVARHGRGYSRFEHAAHDIEMDLLQFVPLEDPIKISRLRFRNISKRTRRLSVTAYSEWVLGPSRAASAPFITTEMDSVTGAMFVRNAWNGAFGSRIAFADLCGQQRDWTGDRREFIGRNGTLANPAALAGTAALSKTVGAGLDPCGALRTDIEIKANDTVEVVFFLGQAESADEARELLTRYRSADLDGVLARVSRHWDDLLGAVQVKTPDRSMDVMLNGWLLYQTLACRLWARCAFYQASGAYGFRDQLQDVMALAAMHPEIAREHLLRAAARQFVDGDVQHWWLPQSGQGVRTKISDDRAWLAYATAHYINVTGDDAILDETIAFLDGPRLLEDEHESFFQPTISDESATLFEHCARALEQSLAVGAHGLPLIGTGDWNDGMNRVGARGEGESVWLGWLLYSTLTAFAPLAGARGEEARATHWRKHATALSTSLDREGWDGAWYLRGWFDDGTPLGSATSEACRIDSIAQAWAVMSGAGDPERAKSAMSAVEQELVRYQDGLALLFTPPFDQNGIDPGYIRSYPPGIRENGGQYTHAALWSVMAFAKLGQGEKACQLFSLLNPINHAKSRAGVQRYKVEPYVVAADIYSNPSHVGRGGWTWYTGSAGWMQRAGIESILGLRLQGTFLNLDPCIPRDWPGFEITIRHHSARYEIVVENTSGAGQGIASAQLDGTEVLARPLRVPLVDDGAVHRLVVGLG